MKSTIKFEGLFKNSHFLSFKKNLQEDIYKESEIGLRAAGNKIKPLIQNDAKKAFKVKRQVFLKSFTFKIFNKDKSKPPGMVIGSKVPFVRIHQDGGIIKPKGKLLLIPVNKNRKNLGKNKFNDIITKLIDSNNAYFRKMKNGNIGLYSENIDENLNLIQQSSGKRKFKKGKKTLIAIAAKQTRVKKTINTMEIINNNTGLVRNEIQNIFNKKF